MELIRNREAEITSQKWCKGSNEFRRDWFCHAKTRLQNIIVLCTEHNVLDHLHNSQVHRIFQQKLDKTPWRGSWICLSARWAGRSTCPRSNCIHVCWLSVMSDYEDEYAHLDDGELGHRNSQTRGSGGGGSS
jgi:hypothetical protein